MQSVRLPDPQHGGSGDQSADHVVAGARIRLATVKARCDCQPGALPDLSADTSRSSPAPDPSPTTTVEGSGAGDPVTGLEEGGGDMVGR